jgi:hypothetical protein
MQSSKEEVSGVGRTAWTLARLVLECTMFGEGIVMDGLSNGSFDGEPSALQSRKGTSQADDENASLATD